MTADDIRQRIWLIADGIPLKLDSMTIQTTDSNKLLVTGWTNTVNFENITKEKVLSEPRNLKSSFTDLTSSFSELNDIITGNELTVEFHIAYDDSGKVGIGLCSEINGNIKWYLN
jgi:hypothetical protein